MDGARWPELGKPEVPDCPECGTPFTRTLIRFDFKGQFFGYFPADVCEKDHRFLTDESDRAIEQLAIRMGLFGSSAPRASRRPKARAR